MEQNLGPQEPQHPQPKKTNPLVIVGVVVVLGFVVVIGLGVLVALGAAGFAAYQLKATPPPPPTMIAQPGR